MATGALFTEQSLVAVILLMTGVTVAFGLLITPVEVTLTTGGGGVQADQGKAGQVVVEGDLLAPVITVVALLALFTQFATVWIINLVTGDAALFWLLLKQPRLMATATT